MSDITVLRAERWVDVDAGEVRSPACIVVEDETVPQGVGVREDGERDDRSGKPQGQRRGTAPSGRGLSLFLPLLPACRGYYCPSCAE